MGDIDEATDTSIAALERLIDSDPVAAVREAAGLGAYWQDAGLVDAGRQLTDRALERGVGAPAVDRAEALLVAAELAFRQDDESVAIGRAGEAIELATSAGRPDLAAIAHVDLARVAYRAGDAAAIEAHAQTALRDAGDNSRARRGALHMLAWAAYTAGDQGLARARFAQSLAYRRETGDALSVAVELANIGDLEAEAGDLRTGARHLREALGLMRDADNRYFLVNTLPSVAALAAQAGLDEDGARLVGAAATLAETSGLVPDPGNAVAVVDEMARRLGTRFEAVRREGTALSASEAMDLAVSVTERVAT